MTRGFFEIGIYHPKHHENIGTLWRSAYQLGASGIFTIGARYSQQSSDTVKSWRHIPCRNYADFDSFLAAIPFNVSLVAVEMGGRSLSRFYHPQQAIYLLGAEDHGLPQSVLDRCHHTVSIEAIGIESYNVAVAGSLMMYSRGLQFGFGKKEVAA